jgi:GxxExxY protein
MEAGQRAELESLAHRVIGAAIEVHRSLGPGFLEAVYEQALAIEFELGGIRFERQYPVGVSYKGRLVGEGRLDFLVDTQLVVELKAVDMLLPIHKAQVISYLKLVKRPLGLLINFNVQVLKQGVKRIILT